ncbi:hypothetical protein BDB00DRAFT_876132 [Zychaea mexicana]|uniref:uncharacterized protein n=1 Tax=Zychaea mexicana TaxID=64656 RepID=UPI0022FE0BE6|nr:uncharacterized protein BDB00DRAFT_876132 [Zychaea mexicana]KAI9489699.1 hypothetical protein BDB00DRAFT_876132 [Zychaea mexicana]
MLKRAADEYAKALLACVASTAVDSTRCNVLANDQRNIHFLEALNSGAAGVPHTSLQETSAKIIPLVNSYETSNHLTHAVIPIGVIGVINTTSNSLYFWQLNSNGRKRASDKRGKDQKLQLKIQNEQTLEAAALSGRCVSRKRDKGEVAAESDDVVNVDGCSNDMSFDEEDFIEAKMSRNAAKEERDLEELRSQRARFVKAANEWMHVFNILKML